MKKMEIFPKSLAVFCSSYSNLLPAFEKAAEELGRGLAKKGYKLVYGGTDCGLMGILAKAHLENGGHVTGVVPSFMIEMGLKSALNQEFVEVPDMANRKSEMAKLSGAFVILPGGLGTLDEFFDILTLKQLKIHQKPIFILNLEDFYNPLLEMLENCAKFGTIKKEYLSLFISVRNVSEILKIV
ncbi:MAG: TIGR00730 family Rossman fold protein [Candidatus Riflebacteria bacterium]|nr:TIGR00730 family Rossman fold protein [Candidatus Riflebacteria bacterium]